MLEAIKDFEMTWKHWLGLTLGLIVLAGSIFILKDSPDWRTFAIVTSLVIMFFPFMISIMFGQASQKEKEDMFLAFSRDLVENVRSGTPVSKSILNLRNRNYGALTSHVQKLSNQLTVGIGLNAALNNFAREVKSPTINRAIGLIAQAERAGGKIETVLEAVANSVNQIETIKKERKAAVSNLVTQGYIIFFVFIIIMLVLEIKILPLVVGVVPEGAEAPQIMGNQPSRPPMDADSLSNPLLFLLITQSLFAGLVIGKLSEGSIKNGIKHSFILVAVTLMISTGARAFFA